MNVSPIEAVAVAWPAVPPLHRIVWPAQAIVPGVPVPGWKVEIFTVWPTARLAIVIVVTDDATSATVKTLALVHVSVVAVAGAEPVTLATTGVLTHSLIVRPVVGSRAAASVPLLMFVALVVSVVADAAKAVPLVFVTVMTPVDVTSAASPDMVKPPNDPELSYWI